MKIKELEANGPQALVMFLGHKKLIYFVKTH